VFYGVGCSHLATCELLPGVPKFTATEFQHTWQQSSPGQGSARNGPRNRKSKWSSQLVVWSRPTHLLFTPAAGPRHRSKKRRKKEGGSNIDVRFESSRIASHRMSTKSPTPNPYAHPSFFPTHALVRAPMSTTQHLLII
jgi:hypothetical protein